MDIKKIVYNLTVSKRLDVFLSEYFKDYSRSFFQRLIKDSYITVNGKNFKAQSRLKNGDLIQIIFPERKQSEIIPENIPLNIIYEDNHIIAINKPRGMVVHPATSHENNTLVNALVYHFGKNLSKGYNSLRPGIVHRLDMGTSGIILVAKSDIMQNHLSKMFLERNIKKRYLAIIYGKIENNKGRIELPIKRGSVNRKRMEINSEGKMAITEFKVKIFGKNSTLLEINLLTGRTHQIRVHFSYLKHPIINDTLYGYKGNTYEFLNGIALHAWKIGFYHPFKDKYIELTAEIPQDFLRLMELEKIV